MTAIYYPDCWGTSSNKKWRLEAKSPHNGAILHRNGMPPSKDEFGFQYKEHQSGFRYQLLNNVIGGHPADSTESNGTAIVWERWQGEKEESPHQVIVSDEGWSVIRLHGFKPALVVLSPSGLETMRVRIVDPEHEERRPSESAPASNQENSFFWVAEHLELSTAGCFWSGNSWPYFFKHSGGSYFVWRTLCGQRLVINIDAAALFLEADGNTARFQQAMDDEENALVYEYLLQMSVQAKEATALLMKHEKDPELDQRFELREQLRRAVAALHLVGVHRISKCLPLLDWWASIDYPSYSTGSHALGRGWHVSPQYFRPVLYNSMRLLRQVPPPYPAYTFQRTDKNFAAAVEGNRKEKAVELRMGMSGLEVLASVGTPDHVQGHSHQMENRLYRWTEDWEYDFFINGNWETLRITWSEEGKASRMSAMETIDSYWLNDSKRSLEYLYI